MGNKVRVTKNNDNIKLLLCSLLYLVVFSMFMFILLSLPNIIYDPDSYNYYGILTIFILIVSTVCAVFLIKQKRRIGWLFIGIGLLTIIGYLIKNNDVIKVQVVSINENILVVKSRYDENYYEIKNIPIIGIKENDYIYVNKTDNKNDMHYTVSPKVGKNLIAISSVIMILVILGTGFYSVKVEKGNKK